MVDEPCRTVPVFLKCVTALLLLVGISATSAAGATYTVNRVVGTGVITGTIDTNGKTGVLTSADITDWNLKVDADGNGTSAQLLGPLSGNNSAITFLTGNALTATPMGMFFDFSLPGLPFTPILQIATATYSASWQLQAGIFHDESIGEAPVGAYALRQPVRSRSRLRWLLRFRSA